MIYVTHDVLCLLIWPMLNCFSVVEKPYAILEELFDLLIWKFHGFCSCLPKNLKMQSLGNKTQHIANTSKQYSFTIYMRFTKIGEVNKMRDKNSAQTRQTKIKLLIGRRRDRVVDIYRPILKTPCLLINLMCLLLRSM